MRFFKNINLVKGYILLILKNILKYLKLVITVLSNLAGIHSFSYLGFCGRDICPKNKDYYYCFQPLVVSIYPYSYKKDKEIKHLFSLIILIKNSKTQKNIVFRNDLKKCQFVFRIKNRKRNIPSCNNWMGKKIPY